MCCAVCLVSTDSGASLEKAWIELESVEAIVKTASKAKFFIEFHSLCLEGTFTSLSYACLPECSEPSSPSVWSIGLLFQLSSSVEDDVLRVLSHH